jgi:hypothetical protein
MDERNIDLEGLLFDYEQYKQRWPKFWESDKGVLLFLLAFCERDPESKQFTYLDFIENFYSMFEFELGAKKYNFLSFGQKMNRRNTEEAIERIFQATPCTLKEDPIKSKWIK